MSADPQPEAVAGAAAEASPKPSRPIRKIVKFLIWAVVLGFVFVLFASILTVIGAWMLFSPTIHANPEGVQEMTLGITEIKIPEGLQPQFAAGEKLLGTKLAVYADPDNQGEERFLLLMAFPHGKQHLPTSVQEFLEEELAVVRPARKRITTRGDRRRNLENLPDSPLLPLDAEPTELQGTSDESTRPPIPIAKKLRDQVHPEIHPGLRDLKYVTPQSGSIELLEGFASEKETQHPYLIRGQEQTITIRRGRKQGEQVVRVFAPFEAKGEKPALLVFGTPEERWEAGDSEKFDAMLKSMN